MYRCVLYTVHLESAHLLWYEWMCGKQLLSASVFANNSFVKDVIIQTVNLWMICRPGQSSTQSNHSSGNAESGIQIWRRRQTSHYRLLKLSGVRAGFAKTAGPPGLRALWPYEQSSRSLHTSTHDVTHVGVRNVVSGGYWLVNISQYCSSWEVC